ncbi:hypothetical protein BC941DRAFT_359195 [Chlamydoabsidia padenii]|nr:hypothetical protein BC941DRAFT_359195 [Chlamydoabsidia padenii]
MTRLPSFAIFSGGSACNYIAQAFHQVGEQNVTYILGISDNGGSTSEILRVLGGPSIGDLRSRLTRLLDMVDTCPSIERAAIKDLLSYRLSKDPDHVKMEWAAIVEGHHRLWKRIPAEKKETIRGFLVHFNGEILKRAHKQFNYCNGSVGNFFITGARLFFGSLEAALFLFSAITGINQVVLPVINTNHMATIAAELQNGDTILGQCDISHPASSNLFYSKHDEPPLPSPIRRLYYINEYGQEIYPVPNPKVITACSNTVVYSIGSLYTSIVPSLILRHVGHAIAHSQSHKILLLNGSNDRETHGYGAVDFIRTITDALNESQRIDCKWAFYQTNMQQNKCPSSSLDSAYGSLPFPDQLFHPSPPHTFISHLVYLDNGEIHVDVVAIERLGIQCVKIKGDQCPSTGKPIYNDTTLTTFLQSLCT